MRRADVCTVFDVTQNHLTREITKYRAHMPKALEYDPTKRAYVRGDRFKPQFASGSPEEYLTLLHAYSVKQSVTLIPTIGKEVSVDVLQSPGGVVDAEVLLVLLQALRKQRGMSIKYQSFNDPEPTVRVIWPHTLVFTGDRWHARAFDERRAEFRDFVLARMLSAEQHDVASPRSTKLDKEWQETELVEVVPARKLSPSQKDVVAREYGMTHTKDGPVWRVKVRRCLVHYFLARFRLSEEARDDELRIINLKDPAIAKRYALKKDAA